MGNIGAYIGLLLGYAVIQLPTLILFIFYYTTKLLLEWKNKHSLTPETIIRLHTISGIERTECSKCINLERNVLELDRKVSAISHKLLEIMMFKETKV